MSIKRAPRKHRYTNINNQVFQNGVLSWRAMGLLSYVLSKPDNWNIIPDALVKVTEGTAKNDRRSTVYDILKELKDSGFVSMTRYGDGSVDYVVDKTFSSPIADVSNEVNKEKPSAFDEISDAGISLTIRNFSGNEHHEIKSQSDLDLLLNDRISFWAKEYGVDNDVFEQFIRDSNECGMCITFESWLSERRKSKKQKNTEKTDGFIYFVSEKSNGHTKIGKTIDMSNRMKTFSVKLPFKIDVLHSFKCRDYSFSERRLHSFFEEKRADGEWFLLDERDMQLVNDDLFLKSLGIEVIK